ncbi:unnamed protein product [Nippostrongylus brasiliensis]|uniref:Secreted protein n=1 Tax=Nippostrongylus brasiliensis TaxID=27835 RepID=A0A0N4YJL5_NIPBR|nr:unnamed protein product [Nippostrongylus brasiliensis]
MTGTKIETVAIVIVTRTEIETVIVTVIVITKGIREVVVVVAARIATANVVALVREILLVIAIVTVIVIVSQSRRRSIVSGTYRQLVSSTSLLRSTKLNKLPERFHDQICRQQCLLWDHQSLVSLVVSMLVTFPSDATKRLC